VRAYLALAAAGFRRYATYRQAMVAAVVTNSVFGFLRFAVMLAVLDGGARSVAGYDEPRLATFVWAGQGLIGVVLLWAPPDLAERIRTGDVVIDLIRPIDPVWSSMAPPPPAPSSAGSPSWRRCATSRYWSRPSRTWWPASTRGKAARRGPRLPSSCDA
jgi:hypothetical protein